MNKSGVSPLISTLILLCFATGLGVIVMSWGSTYAQIELQDICSKTSLSFVEISSKPQVCISQGRLFYTLQNTGETNINNYRITLIGTKGIQNLDINQQIPIGDIIRTNKEYDVGNVERIEKIIFMPRLNSGKSSPCPKSSESIDFVESCTY